MIKAVIHMTLHLAIMESDALGGGKNPTSWEERKKGSKKERRMRRRRSMGEDRKRKSTKKKNLEKERKNPVVRWKVRARKEKPPRQLLDEPHNSPLWANWPKLAVPSSPATDQICQIFLNAECWVLVGNGKGSLGNSEEPVAAGLWGTLPGTSCLHGAEEKEVS